MPYKAALNIDTNFEMPLYHPVDLDDLVESDWVAHQFANQYRDFLQIPPEVASFHVHRRLKTEKRLGTGGDKVQDIVFRVSWDHVEENDIGGGLPGKRRITVGTTLVINADSSRDVEVDGGGGFIEMAQTPGNKYGCRPIFQSRQAAPPDARCSRWKGDADDQGAVNQRSG